MKYLSNFKIDGIGFYLTKEGDFFKCYEADTSLFVAAHKSKSKIVEKIKKDIDVVRKALNDRNYE
jgi:hypothetical protein